MLAFFTPWSAINLVDFYLISKERYDVPALSNPNGRYGRWNLHGILVYAFGVVIQLPFIATHFYTGPLVEYLGGTDISWIIGLTLPGLVYYIVARNSANSVPERLILPAEPAAV